MAVDQELSALIGRKSDEDLKEMLLNSSEWSDEALEFAKIELEKRGSPTTEVPEGEHNLQLSDRTQYKIFGHTSGELTAVKIGWCWPAFFFDFIWAMVGNMWDIGVGLLLLYFLFGYFTNSKFEENSSYGFINLLFLVLKILFGVKGNTWREKNLCERGFELKGIVMTTDKDRAIRMFLKNRAGVAS